MPGQEALSPFEAATLLCFGAAWPVSIIKSWRSRSVEGKSVLFLWIVLVGYVSGIFHKLHYDYDLVLSLWILNGTMVSIDIVIYYRNKRLTRKDAMAEEAQ